MTAIFERYGNECFGMQVPDNLSDRTLRSDLKNEEDINGNFYWGRNLGPPPVPYKVIGRAVKRKLKTLGFKREYLQMELSDRTIKESPISRHLEDKRIASF